MIESFGVPTITLFLSLRHMSPNSHHVFLHVMKIHQLPKIKDNMIYQ